MTESYFKNKQPGKWDPKWRPGYRIVCIEHDGHYLHIENQATRKTQSCNVKNVVLEPPDKFWNIDTQFSRAGKYINHPINLPTITISDWKWTLLPMYLVTCKLPALIFLPAYFTWLYLPVPQPQERAGNQFDSNVLKAYPTCYSWIITAHISLGNLERQWKSFTWQMDRTWQLLKSLCQWTSAPTHLISTLQAELTNLDNIYTSYRPTSQQLLNFWRWTLIWWHFILKWTHQKKPFNLFRQCPKLAHRKCHD